MTGVMSILEFVAKTKAIDQDLKEVGHAIVVKACMLSKLTVRHLVIGGSDGSPSRR